MFNRVTPFEFRHVLLKLGHSTTVQSNGQYSLYNVYSMFCTQGQGDEGTAQIGLSWPPAAFKFSQCHLINKNYFVVRNSGSVHTLSLIHI